MIRFYTLAIRYVVHQIIEYPFCIYNLSILLAGFNFTRAIAGLNLKKKYLAILLSFQSV